MFSTQPVELRHFNSLDFRFVPFLSFSFQVQARAFLFGLSFRYWLIVVIWELED